MLCMKRKRSDLGYRVSVDDTDRRPQTTNRKPKTANRKPNIGFTLVELLLVLAMLAIVSLAVYATFNSGIKIWQRINTEIPEEDLDIFFYKFSSDLRNSFKFTGIDFLGEKDKVAFSTLVDSQRLKKRTIGQVIYSYDFLAEILNREERDFSQIYSDESNIATQSLRNIKSLKFQYYSYDKEKKEYLWNDEWQKKELPLAIRIELEFDDSTQANKFTKTVSIPAGG